MTSDVVCDVSSFAPSLSHYRREWTPKGDVGLSGLWVGAVVSDASGRQYWGLRGADDFVRGHDSRRVTDLRVPLIGT